MLMLLLSLLPLLSHLLSLLMLLLLLLSLLRLVPSRESSKLLRSSSILLLVFFDMFFFPVFFTLLFFPVFCFRFSVMARFPTVFLCLLSLSFREGHEDTCWNNDWKEKRQNPYFFWCIPFGFSVFFHCSAPPPHPLF